MLKLFKKQKKKREKTYLLFPQKIINRLSLLIINTSLYLVQCRYQHLTFNSSLFFDRKYLFNFYATVLLYTLIKVSFISRDNTLITRFYGMSIRNITAQFIVNYIIIKLSQYFALNPIIKPLIRRIKRLTFVSRFKIIICGRLTRRERAAYHVEANYSLPLSTCKINVDYAFDFKIMKFGVVGIRAFLLYITNVPTMYFVEIRNKL